MSLVNKGDCATNECFSEVCAKFAAEPEIGSRMAGGEHFQAFGDAEGRNAQNPIKIGFKRLLGGRLTSP